MFRHLLLLGVLTLALPVMLPRQAEAHDSHDHGCRAHYQVLYRPDCHCRWRPYGVYQHRGEAEHAAHHLRHHGYEVHIDVRG